MAKSGRAKTALILTVIVIACGGFGITLLPLAQKPLDGWGILSRVQTTYQNCKTYRDRGTSTTKFDSTFLVVFKHNHTRQLSFSTAFARDGRFRFEYIEQSPEKQDLRYLIWANDHQVKTWWDVTNKLETSNDLGLAIAGATGVSNSTAHTIPALLMTERIRGWLITQPEQVERLSDGDDRGVDCYRVRVTSLGDSEVVWIDMQSFLIRRIDESRDFDDFKTTETTLYSPEINVDLSEKDLVFDPPAKPREQGVLERLIMGALKPADEP